MSANEFPWLPLDYQRTRARVRAGDTRYGFEWFDKPTRPADIADAAIAANFSTAYWIGRRNGQLIGYENTATVASLCEWRGSQKQVRRRYADMAALILSQIHPDSDRRPVVPFKLVIPGMSFGNWHDTGMSVVADCIFNVGQEELGLTSLLERDRADWDLTMTRSDHDSWLSAKRDGGAFALLHARHGSVGDWYPVDRLKALNELLAVAPFNDGAYPQSFAKMEIKFRSGNEAPKSVRH
jgi:hypothetical protein